MKNLIFILALFLSLPAMAHSWHVRPSNNKQGTRPGGNGTETKAWDLQTAFANRQKLIKPGDTIWVHSGSYWGYWDSVDAGSRKILSPQMYVSQLVGTVHKPIVVKAYPGEQPVFTGDTLFGLDFFYTLCPACVIAKIQRPMTMIKVNGKNTWFWGLEFTSNWRLRESNEPGEAANNIREGTAVMVMESDSIKLINLHVHDVPGLGISGYGGARNTEVYGCLSYYNGFSDVPLPGDKREGFRKNGPGIYMQNDSTADKPSVKVIENNIVFKNFSLGFEIYGSKNAHVNHFRIINNVVFNNGAPGNSLQKNILVGGGMNTYDNQIIGNTLFAPDGSNLAIGYKGGVENTSYLIKDNNIIGGEIEITNGTGLSFIHNTIMANFSWRYQLCPLPKELKEPSVKYIQNTFYRAYPKALFYHSVTQCDNRIECYAGVEGDLDYKAYNVDPLLGNAKGNIAIRKMYLSQDVKISMNRYDPGLAQILVLNWDSLKQIALDFRKIVPDGAAYQLIDVQDMKNGPILRGTSNGSVVITPSDKVQVPVGYGDAVNHTMVLPAHTPSTLNVYLLKFFPYQVKLVQDKKVLTAEFFNSKGEKVKPENVFRYTWKHNGKMIEESGGISLSVKDAGEYTLQVTMQNMLTGEATQKVKL